MLPSSSEKTKLSKQLCGIQHVGITVEDMSKALEFYTEVLGGKLIGEIEGIEGDGIHNTLLQKEEIDAISNFKNPLELSVPDLRSGKHKLDVYLVQFENIVLQLLQYRDAFDP